MKLTFEFLSIFNPTIFIVYLFHSTITEELMLLWLTSSQSSGPQTARRVLSGLHAKKETPWLLGSNDLLILRFNVSGSKSHIITVLSLEPVASLPVEEWVKDCQLFFTTIYFSIINIKIRYLRPSGENLQNHTSSQWSVSIWIVSQGKSCLEHWWSTAK